MLLCSLFTPCIPFIHGTLSYSVISVILLLYIITIPNILYFKCTTLTIFSFLLLCLFISIHFSVINGASIYINFVKYIQVSIIIFFLLFNKLFFVITKKDVAKIIYLFIFFNIIFGIIIHFFYNGYNIGLIRFSGLFFDSNYFAIYCFIFYVLSDTEFLNKKILKRLNFLLIILSLSLTGYIVLLVYIIIKHFFYNFKNTKIIYYLYICFSFFISIIFVFTPFFLNNIQNISNNSLFFSYKIVSLTKRFEAQMLAYDLFTQSISCFVLGLGSGRNLELTNIALHSFFIQALFSHGIIYFLILLFIIVTMPILFCKNFIKDTHIVCFLSFFISFFIACGTLDPFFNAFSILFLLLVSAFTRSILLSSQNLLLIK